MHAFALICHLLTLLQNACDSNTIQKRERGRRRNSFYCCQFGWKRITSCCQKTESQDNLVFCQIPRKSTQTFRFYIPKQVYCPRHSGCCGSTERRFALSERLWPVHSECRITQVLLLHPLPPASVYAHEALVRWLLILSTTVYASQRLESLQFFCVHIVCGCPSNKIGSHQIRAAMHSHPLQDAIMRAAHPQPQPVAPDVVLLSV